MCLIIGASYAECVRVLLVLQNVCVCFVCDLKRSGRALWVDWLLLKTLDHTQCMGRDLSAGSYASSLVLFLFRAALAEVRANDCR